MVVAEQPFIHLRCAIEQNPVCTGWQATYYKPRSTDKIWFQHFGWIRTLLSVSSPPPSQPAQSKAKLLLAVVRPHRSRCVSSCLSITVKLN